MSTPFVPPLDWPHYGIGFLPAVKRVFQKYATFSGRASRSEFWWWMLANVVVGSGLYVLMFALGVATANRPGQVIGPGGWPFLILLVVWVLGTIVPNIAVTVRRLHDAGYSGWFYLFNVVGLGIVTLVLCVLETSPNAAQYGPPYPQTVDQGYGPPPGSLPEQGYAQQGYSHQGYPAQDDPAQGYPAQDEPSPGYPDPQGEQRPPQQPS